MQTEPSVKSAEKSVIGRFLHLLSAQGAEGILSTAFFLYLARLDSTIYGEIMYALAAGSVAMKVVQFGLYYPLVSTLGSSGKEEAPRVLSRVNTIKLFLFAASMAVMVVLVLFKGFNIQMSLVVLLMGLGFCMEAVSETYFADLRVRGLQDKEARIKMISTVAGYGYGIITAVIGLNTVIISLFKIISSAIRLLFALKSYLEDYGQRILFYPEWEELRVVFGAASTFAIIEILGIVYNKTNIFFLENSTGVKGVALYSATWNLVDPVSVLASEQFLGWVVFPLLASLWFKKQDEAAQLVRTNALWLMALAFPIIFFLHVESDFLITTIYGSEYKDAAWMQQYLVWTILLSFENNLFSYAMMVAGAVKVLLIFTLITTLLNLLFNVLLVEPYGLAGGCMVIILTKGVMTLLTFLYCRLRYDLFRTRNFVLPLTFAGASYLLFMFSEQVIGRHPATALTLGVYLGILWFAGPKFLGTLPRK